MRGRAYTTALLAIGTAVVPQVKAQVSVSGPAKLARISGVVIDAQESRPLRRANVCFRYRGDGGYYSSETERCDETDGQGRFSLSTLPPGKYTYSAFREGYFEANPLAEDLPSVIALDAGQELSVKLRMRRRAAISGRVVFEDGEPYLDALLELNGPYGGIARSNDKGEYRFANLLAGDYKIVTHQPAVEDCGRFSTHSRRIYVGRNRALDSLPVHVDWGQEASGPDIVMVDAVPHRIAGRAFPTASLPGPDGRSISEARASSKPRVLTDHSKFAESFRATMSFALPAGWAAACAGGSWRFELRIRISKMFR